MDTVTGLFLFSGVCFIVYTSLIFIVLFVCLFPVRSRVSILTFRLPVFNKLELSWVVGSRLDYCNSLLYSVSAANLNKLQQVHYKIALLSFKSIATHWPTYLSDLPGTSGPNVITSSPLQRPLSASWYWGQNCFQ